MPNIEQPLATTAISTWAAQLFDAARAPSASAAPAEYLCLSHLLPLLSPGEAEPLWRKISAQPLDALPPGGGILLGGLLTELPWSERNDHPELEFAQQLMDHHLFLTQQLDPTESGLLHLPTEAAFTQPALQASWIWSADQLLGLAGIDRRNLALWQELYLYESNERLWHAAADCYAAPDLAPTFSESVMVGNILALYVGLPDQERAERVLRRLQRHAPVWQSPPPPTPSRLHTVLYLLYHALLDYDMTAEAETVRQYAQKHLTSPPENARESCLHLLWERVIQ